MFIEIPDIIKIQSIFSFFVRKADSMFYFEGESHPFWEMVYVSEGSVGITADERIYTLSEGDMILHKPMEFHKIWSHEGTQPKFCVISFKACGNGTELLKNLALKCTAEQRELMERIISLKDAAFVSKNKMVLLGINDEMYAAECIKMLELLLCRATYNTEKIEVTNFSDALLFSRAVSVLTENIGTKMSVEQLASSCFVSSSKIKKIFTKFVGCGAAEYFNFMKIARAKLQLNKGLSVLEVSEEFGFSNQFYFSSVFKRVTGMTPTEYKKGVKQKNNELY